jgi:TldD protein
VFAPGVAGVIAHELIGHALEGDTVARGRTWLRPGLDLTAGRPVTVIDDPRRGRGAWTLDDEGIAPRETLLIDGGRSVGTLLDKSSAAALRVASTGHGRRSSYLDAVHPRMGCTFIVSGSDEPDEVLRSTAEGVFIRRMVAGQTDPLTGRATFVVTDADRIVEGRIAEPIELFVLELDGVEAWRSIDRVAHDLAFDTCIGSCVRDGQPIAVSVGAPTIRIGVATVRS